MERWATKPVHQGRARTAATPLHWRVRWATRAAVSRTGGPVPVHALEWRGAGGAPESRCRVQHGSVAGAWAHSPCRGGHWPAPPPETRRNGQEHADVGKTGLVWVDGGGHSIL